MATRQWLREPTAIPRHRTSDHHSVVADQIRELATALEPKADALAQIVDRVLATPRSTSGVTAGRTVTVDVPAPPPIARAAADIVATMEELALAGGSPTLAIPADARRLLCWIADEIDIQTGGDPPTAYAASDLLCPPPCPLLRATMAHALGLVTIHAYRHAGFAPQQVAAVRSSRIAVALAERPGATFAQLLAGRTTSRLDVLTELGDLIELGAVFGIDHRWYPYDITVLALRDANAARCACDCLSAAGATN